MADALEARLGRSVFVRKVMNQREWYVTDPALSFVERGTNHGIHGYRAGLHVDLTGRHRQLSFYLVHSPVLARLFKKNVSLAAIVGVARATARFRSEHWLYRDSRLAARDGSQHIVASSLADLVRQLHAVEDRGGFVRDLFPRTHNRGRKGVAGPYSKWAGHTFRLPLCDRLELISSPVVASRLVKLAWPLLACLYPQEAKSVRSAHLARRLADAGFEQSCERHRIVMPRGVVLARGCRGRVEGAHIVPHAHGGSDQAENGLWLCAFHHRETEGRLRGRRSGLVTYRHTGPPSRVRATR